MAHRIKWRAKVEHLVACNCDWGCPCAFEARPTAGHCEGVVGHRMDARAQGQKRAALEAIATGRAGGPIGVLMSTVDAGVEVREAKIDFKMAGLNPVTKAPHYPAALLPTGLLVKREDYFSNKACAVTAGDLTMNHVGKNAHAAIGNWKGP